MDLNKYLSVLDNDYVSSALSIFLVVYAGMAAPQLPERVARLFENTVFRVLIFFLIAYTSQKNPTVAIIAAVGLMVSLQTLGKYDVMRLVSGMIIPQVAEMPVQAPVVTENEPEGVSEDDQEGAPLDSTAPTISHCDGNLCNVETQYPQMKAPVQTEAGPDLTGFDCDESSFAEF